MNLNNTQKQSLLTGTATAKNVLEKFKALGSSISNKTSEGIEEVNASISPVNSSDNTSSSIWTILRYILIIILISFVILIILASMGLLSPNLAKFFNPILIILGVNPADNSNSSNQDSNLVSNAVTVPADESEDLDDKKSINKLLDKADTDESVPIPDEACSTTQSQRSSSKIGYCYVGEDRGSRTCIKVDDNDTCISGDIFPTREICINPSLRP